MKRKLINTFMLSLLILLILVGVYSQQWKEDKALELPAKNNDSVAILSAAPADTSLKPGDKVTFQYNIGYNFESADRATLFLEVKSEGERYPLASVGQLIDKGRGTVDLQVTFVVPETRAIVAVIAIIEEGKRVIRVFDRMQHDIAQP